MHSNSQTIILLKNILKYVLNVEKQEERTIVSKAKYSSNLNAKDLASKADVLAKKYVEEILDTSVVAVKKTSK